VLSQAGFDPVVHSTTSRAEESPQSTSATWGDPNLSFPGEKLVLFETPVICVNNPFILEEEFLRKHASVYNIHNSDVAKNRGLAQICTIDTMLDGGTFSGVSLQKISAGLEVDASPTLHIETFPIPDGFGFEDIMSSLQNVWLRVLSNYLVPHLKAESVLPEREIAFGPVVTHASVSDKVLKQGAFSGPLMASGLGNFSRFFPRTEGLIAGFREHWRQFS